MNPTGVGVDESANLRAARRLVEQARAIGVSIGTCESLTGGGVAATITSVPGASQVFRGALVTYASELKTELAGVDAAHVAEHGVINEWTALAMARGARERLGVDLAGACTGVAGPDPQDGCPPGTVWIAVAGPLGEQARGLDLAGDREIIRQATCHQLLDLLCTGEKGVWGIRSHG